MVIVNEYHHVAASSFEKVRKVAKVKYPAVGTLTVTWVFTPEDGQYAKRAGRWTVLLRPESKKETARWAVSFLRGGKGDHSGSHSGPFTGDVLHDQQGGNDAHQGHGQSQHGSHQSGEQEADQGGDTNRQGIG